MCAANTWVSELAQIKDQSSINYIFTDLLTREELSPELRTISRLLGGAIALYPFPERGLWFTTGPQKSVMALTGFFSTTPQLYKILDEDVAPDQQTKAYPITKCNYEGHQLSFCPLHLDDRCLAYLIVGRDYQTGLGETEDLVCYLRDNLQQRLREAEKAGRAYRFNELLRERSELFRAVYYDSPYAMAIVRARDGTFLGVNPAFCQESGLSEDKLLHQSVTQFFLPTHLSLYEKQAELIRREGRVGPTEVQIQAAAGQKYILYTAKAIRLAGEPCFIIITVDISARKSAQQALSESEALFRAIFEHSPLPIIITNTATNRHSLVNPAFTRVTGQKLDEVIGLPANYNFCQEEEAIWRAFCRKVQAEGHAENAEIRLIGKNGEMRKMLFSSALVNYQGEQHALTVPIDITERVRAEEQLRLNEERYRLVAEFTGQLHYDWNIASGVILWAGRSQDVLGFSLAEMNQGGLKGGEDLIHPADRQQAMDLLELAMRSKEPYHCEYRLRKANGDYLFIEDEGKFLYNEQGQAVRMLGVCKDVSVRVRNETELWERNEELMRFTYTASHDLRSPLITIKSFLGLLEQDIEQQNIEQLPQRFMFINMAAEKMTKLLDELLGLSRIGREINPPIEISLQDLVQETVDLLRGRLVERNVEVVITDEPLVLFGDHTRLRELFQNLLDNAAKFMGDQPSPRVEVGAQLIDGQWHIFVRDNGIGIEKEYQDKIFGLFEKLDQNIEGTGIGLTIVKRIVEVHHGQITVESAGLGQGTTFHFTLSQLKKINV